MGYEVKGYQHAESFATAEKSHYSCLKDRAKEQRRNPTDAERVMWILLRSSFKGIKFRRQHAIGDYIVDFVCFRNKLVIEIDGGYHESERQKELDNIRTDFLSSHGFEVIRFTNDEVLHYPDETIEKIEQKFK